MLIAQFVMGSRVGTNFTLVKCLGWKSYMRKMLRGGCSNFYTCKNAQNGNFTLVKYH